MSGFEVGEETCEVHRSLFVFFVELEKQKKLPVYSMKKLDAALKHIGDWDEFEASRQVLTKTMLQRAGV